MTMNEKQMDEMITSCINEELRKVINESIAHANCYGVPRGLLEYKKNEQEDILMVENRSVAAYVYRNEIKQINSYLSDLISNGKLGDYYINLNEYGTFIDWAKEFVLWIEVKNEEEDAEYLDKKTIINNGIVEIVFIRIRVNPFRHNEALISQYLYHELNHCKDDIQRKLNNNPSLDDALNGGNIKYQEAYANMRDENEFVAYPPYLIYNLFADTELNAYVSQFYSELEDSNTTRNQFSGFFSKSFAFKRYRGFLDIISFLEKTKGWENNAMSYFNQNFKSIPSFKSWFLGRAKYKASKFYKKLCKVADLYYDTIEGKYNEQPNR